VDKMADELLNARHFFFVANLEKKFFELPVHLELPSYGFHNHRLSGI
jgi:hypothetical protein